MCLKKLIINDQVLLYEVGMRKHFTIILFLLTINFYSFSQNEDRHKIDSLKKTLPFLKYSGRINCLNELSDAYHWFQADTAKMYANQALKEAEKINYVQGIAIAYKNFGRIECALGTNFLSAEKYFSISLPLFMKTGDKQEIAWMWVALGYTKWVLCKFPEAMEAYEKAEQLLKKTGDTNTLAINYEQAGLAALEWGNYEKALYYALKFEELTGEEHTFILSDLYKILGDYETALEYHRKMPGEGKDWQYKYLSSGSTFYLKKQYDSANHYYQLFSNYAKTAGAGPLSKLYARLGELHLALKHYGTALVYLNDALNMHKKSNDRNQVMWVLLRLSKTYIEKRDYKRGMQTVQELLQIANETGARQYSRDAHFLHSELFEHLQKQDSAYSHLRQYTVLKDSIDLNLSAQKLAFYKTKSEREQAQSRFNILHEEKKLQQQQLKQTAQQKNLLIAGIAVLLLIGVILFRIILLKRKNEKNRRELAENELRIQKLESERKQAGLQQQATDLEMQALRAQMNPHFIFNCLNAINGFILINESETAADYLTKFSRLIRMVLNNSQKKFISLDEELETLGLYLYMEALRSKNNFNYQIKCDDTIDALSIFIPPLLLQPFAENAIWHGLMNKEGDGELLIDLHLENNILQCTITDNGVGRKQAAILKSKSAEKNKSMGLQITKNRMALLNRDLNGESFFEITDLKDEWGNATGTSVSLKIKIKEKQEENVSEDTL